MPTQTPTDENIEMNDDSKKDNNITSNNNDTNNKLVDDKANDMEFKIPTKRKRCDTPSPIKTTGVTLKNAFEILMHPIASKAKTSAKEKKTKIQSNVKLPPIKVQGSFKDPKQAMDSIKAMASTNVSFQLRPNGFDIMTKSEKDYNAIKSQLNENNIPYFTYSLKGDRPNKIILKGIHSSYDPNEIKAELIANKVPAENVYPMFKKGKIAIDMFLVHLSKNANINDIKKNTKYVLNQAVKWENFIKKTIGTQCRKCQKFGHAASNCGMEYRCVKCVHKHKPNECPLDDKLPPTCVNCNGNHTANNRNCSEYLKYVEKINAPKKSVSNSDNTKDNVARSDNIRHTNTTEVPYQHVNPNVLYSDALKGTPPVQTTGGSMNFLFDEISGLFNCGIVDLLRKIQEFVPIYKQQQDVLMKRIMIIDFLSQFA